MLFHVDSNADIGIDDVVTFLMLMEVGRDGMGWV